MKYIVEVQRRSGGTVIGETESLWEAKRLAGDFIGVNDLIWNLSFTNVWWSDERYGGEKLAITFHIFEVE